MRFFRCRLRLATQPLRAHQRADRADDQRRPDRVFARHLDRCAGLRLQAGRDFEVVNPEDDTRFRQYWETYHQRNARNGVTPDMAKAAVRRSNTTIAALMVHLGDADGMLCGLVGRFDNHL